MDKAKRTSIIYALGSIVASLALMVTAINVNSVCFWVAHQDEVPASAKRLSKF